MSPYPKVGNLFLFVVSPINKALDIILDPKATIVDRKRSESVSVMMFIPR